MQGDFAYYGATGQMDSINKYKFDGKYVLVAEDGTVYGSNGKSPMIQTVSGKFWVSNHAHILQGRDDLDTDYLALALEGVDIHSQITGAVQLKLSKENLLKTMVYFPDRVKRMEILDTVYPIDQKITLNRRMNETLEQMGQALFRHYFIDNPEARGWPVGKLSDLVSITMGQSPPGSSYNEQNNGVVFYQGRAEFGARYPSNRLYTTSPSRLAKRGDVLLSVRAPVGDINQATEDCCVGRGLAAISSSDGQESYCYYLMNSLQPKLQEYNAEGTVFGAINGKQLHALKVQIPPVDLRKHFNMFVTTLDQKILIQSEEVNSLITLRDSLLPRLISGSQGN